jgi:tetratricopeptide (TPR) repeat protein/class 3 adenylate cyclase
MKNLIPHFIADMYEKKNTSGSFKGSVMSLDLKGFTKMTEELMKNGKYGAEILSDIINGVFGPVIRSIHQNGGYITAFVGDAITAVFPAENYSGAEASSIELTEFFKKNKSVNIGRKKYCIEIRIGIAYGKIEWNIISTPERSVYFFKGNSIYKAADAQQKAEPGKFLKDRSYKTGTTRSNPKVRSKNIKTSVLERFAPDRVLEMSSAGEFREIISVYLSFDEKNTDIVELSKALCTESVRYKGYLNKIDFGDKGGIALAFFGAPLKEEKYPEYALSFALNMVKRFPKIRIGLAKGTAFCGFVGNSLRSEYTALGEVVNLSARLLGVTPPGEIRTDQWTTEYGYRNFSFTKTGSHIFKGFSGEMHIYVPHAVKVERKSKGEQSVFVGREREKEKLYKLISPVLHGKIGGYVQINGNAGIGKTYLAEAAFGSLNKDQFKLLRLSCDTVATRAFDPIVAAISENAGLNADLCGNEKRKLLIKHLSDIGIENAGTVYFLADLAGIEIKNKDLQSLNSKEKYDAELYSLRSYLISFSSKIPLIIFVDDIHKADEGTLDLLRSLAGTENELVFCIVATSRFLESGYAYEPVFDGVKKSFIDLNTLDKTSVTEIVKNILSTDITDKLLELIWSKAGGNPFYTGQLTMYLKEKGLIFKKAEFSDIIAQEHSIPESISTIIIARIDKLSMELRRSLSAASVLGKEFSVKVLAAMLRDKKIRINIDKIEKEAFWESLSEMIYIFKHALIRDSVYEMLLRKTLKELHSLAADTIFELNKDDGKYYSELAYHYEKAGDRRKTIKFLELAGKYAYENYHLKNALEIFTKYLPYLKNPAEISDVNRILGEINFILGDWSKAELHYKTAIKLFKENTDPVHYVKNLSAYCDLLIDKGEVDIAYKNLKKCLRISKVQKDKLIEGNIYNQLGSVHRLRGDFPEAIKNYTAALKNFENIDNQRDVAASLDHLGMCYMNTGDPKKALKYFDRALKIVEEIKDTRGILTVYNNMGEIFYMRGEADKALSIFTKASEMAEKIFDVRKVSIISGHIGGIFYYKGDYKTAFEYYEKSLKTARWLGDLSQESYLSGNIGVIYRLLGDNRNSVKNFERQLELAKMMRNKTLINISLGNIAFMHSIVGKFDKSNKLYLESLKIGEDINDTDSISINYANIAENFRLTGNFDEALEYYKKAFKITNDLGLKYYQLSAYFYYGLLLNDLNRKQEAIESVRNSLKLSEELNRPDYTLKAKSLLYILDDSVDVKVREKELLEFLKTPVTEEQKGRLNLSLFKITSKNVYRTEAKKSYSELYKTFRYFEYKKALEELN